MGRVAGKVALVAGAGRRHRRRRGRGAGTRGARRCSAPTAMVPRPRNYRCSNSCCRRAGGRVASSTCAIVSAVDAAVAAVVPEFGRLDIVLESAGISHRRNFLEVDAETWDRIIAVNLTGMFHVGQAAARQMVKEGGGSIINVTSQLAGRWRGPSGSPMSPRRAARARWTQAMAVRSGGARHPRQTRSRPARRWTGLTPARAIPTPRRGVRQRR